MLTLLYLALVQLQTHFLDSTPLCKGLPSFWKEGEAFKMQPAVQKGLGSQGRG